MTTERRDAGFPPVQRDGAQGFTLIELLIVVVVLGILAGIAVFGVARFRTDATAAACNADLATVSRAAVAYEASTGTYPAGVDVLVAGRYLKNPPAGTYRFDATRKAVTRDPACSGAATVITGIGGKCVDVAGSSTADGAVIQLLTCNGSAGQQWTLPASWPGPVMAMGKCMAGADGNTANRTRVQLYPCDGSAPQLWNLESGDMIRNPQSGRCFDAENATSADGTLLIIWDCHGNSNQRWVLP